MDSRDLPIDILYEILIELDVKTLKRFQCVSKSWRSLISEQGFREDYDRRRTQQDPLILAVRKESTDTLALSTYDIGGILIKKFSIKHDLQGCSYNPIQSCQGWVCIKLDFHHIKHQVILCNPSTEEFVALPPRLKDCRSVFGFGYAASTKKYKVVRFFTYRETLLPDGLHSFCEVFTLGSSEWRKTTSPPMDSEYADCVPFIHGALHMMPISNFGNTATKDCIYAFDIESENYTKIALPKSFATSSINCVQLKELGGSLFLFIRYEMSMELWCMKDYNSRQWVKEYTIDLNPLGSPIWVVEPRTIMHDGRLLLGLFKVESGNSLYAYDAHDKSFARIIITGCLSTIYVESLLPLRSCL